MFDFMLLVWWEVVFLWSWAQYIIWLGQVIYKVRDHVRNKLMDVPASGPYPISPRESVELEDPRRNIGDVS